MKRIVLISVGLICVLLIFLAGIGFFSFIGNSGMKEGRIHVHKPVHLPSSLNPLPSKTLIFFGYAGCEDVCTPRLGEIAQIYRDYEKSNLSGDLGVIFINLDLSQSSADADRFAKLFHPAFVGVTLPKNELLKVSRLFNAYFSAGLKDTKEIQHTQFLYFVVKDSVGGSYLDNIYITIPYDKMIILHDLAEKIR